MSAASYIAGIRWANTRDIGAYAEATRERPALDFVEELRPQKALGEEIMLRLRTCQGVDLDRLSARFGLDAPGLHEESIRRLTELDLVSRQGAHLRLTRDGLMVADSVCMEFL